MTVGGMKMTASTEKKLDDVVLRQVDETERGVEQELHFLRFEARVLLQRLQVAQSRFRRLAHRLRSFFGTAVGAEEEQEPLDRHHAFSQVRDLLVFAAEVPQRVGIDLAAPALVALGAEHPTRDLIEPYARLAECAGRAVDRRVDEADSDRVGIERLPR